MKLLFDENLSPDLPGLLHDLPGLLHDLYPGSEHVNSLTFPGERDPDQEIWEHAADYDFVATTKDKDFLQKSRSFGAPPKLIMVRLGNTPTARVEAALRSNYDALQRFYTTTDPIFYLL